MIQFACPSCGSKFKVQPQFAGKSSRCPACKKPLVVPAPGVPTVIPKGNIDGSPSSLHHAGCDADGVTLPPSRQNDLPTAPPEPTRTVNLQTHAEASGIEAGRYRIEDEIARGGMGAVLRGIDRDLRREVAIKFMLNDQDAKQKARFVEEAQITGQLEHPNIVPIHELGVDAKKRLFFTMKMVKGKSLAEVLKLLEQQPDAARVWPLSRLLNVLVGICHALAYAHSRNVIHRDLKPANIMLGDFGEVYVMDWGLAKVLGTSETEASVQRGLSGITNSSGSESVSVTAPRVDGDLTQDGAILGTPAYMPPEQARGEVHRLDQRSDIYSLGAILYAMLTLQGPIEKQDEYLALLMRVVEGDIKPPEARAPQRSIPPELSAIAMKALSKDPAQRYASVEAMRRDIERYQEGRSVSAKQDTPWEQIQKFVKRNKGLSAGLGLAVLVLLVSLVMILNAWRETSAVYASREERTRQAVPAFLDAANKAIGLKEIDKALAQASLALEYQPDNADAMLLKGQILASRKEFSAAARILNEYSRRKPDDESAAKLAELCVSPDMDAPGVQGGIGQTLMRMKQLNLGLPFFQAGEQQLAVYRKQISDGLGKKAFSLLTDLEGRITFNQNVLNTPATKTLTSIEYLRGIPISKLTLMGMPIRDLEPLKGMPITHLELGQLKFLESLAPLKGMPIKHLKMRDCERLKDFSVLAGMPLESVDIHLSPEIEDMSFIRNSSLRSLSISGISTTAAKGPRIEDFSPLHGLPLQHLNLSTCRMQNLNDLKGLPLKTLNLFHCRNLSDLSALKGMELEDLNVGYTKVSDLTPLKGMPLKKLKVDSAKVSDLTPLQGMNLEEITYTLTPPRKGLEVLRAMDSLRVINGKEADEYWRKFDAGEIK